MAAQKTRLEVGFAGGFWGLAVGLIAANLAATFLAGGETIPSFIFLLVAAPFAAVGGAVFGVRGALRSLPFLLPLRLSNISLLRTTGSAVGVPAALIAAFSLPFNPFIPPPDETLLADFRRNETELNQIVGMIQHDKGLRRVDDTWTMPHNPESVGVTRARLALYRRRLQNVGTPRGFFVPPPTKTGNEIQFFKWVTGSAISSTNMKGFVYRVRPPKKTRKTLDNCDGEWEAYRHIKGNWYLFYRHVAG